MLAQEEARRLGHNFVGTEQILLGLIGEGTGIAAKVLKSMGINLKDARVEVEKIIGRGSGFVAEAVGAGVGGGSTNSKMPTLEEYGTNLTKLAEEGKINHIVGRGAQIERGLLRELQVVMCQKRFEGKKVMDLLVAGTKYRGEFEE
ncbi:hypothetical protein MKW98_026723 [Papaver atlanticum]|uniref:Clp R domain-containing protein n=1 Tax=Papaver atlanticum TaxID=357466 RepID=A0AAD4S0E3_9MAGN|nr:hypothetical protein MKW98_026723 [Papaver atlanticum]